MQRLPGSGFSPGSIAGIGACLRWNGRVEVVFAVPLVRMPGSDLIRAASRQDASRELGWGWAATNPPQAAAVAWWNGSFVIHMAWRMTANLRTTATFAILKPAPWRSAGLQEPGGVTKHRSSLRWLRLQANLAQLYTKLRQQNCAPFRRMLSATPWYGPYRMMAPAFKEAASEIEADVQLVKLNSEAEPSIAARLGIRHFDHDAFCG